MRIFDVLMLLKEYNASNTNTTLAAPGGKKASGKNYDNILTGKSQPYKNDEYVTKYAKIYPALAEIVKKIKNQEIDNDIMVTGKALAEIGQLFQTYKPKETANGEFSLPFGDNVRIKQRGNVIFIGKNKTNNSTLNSPAITSLPVQDLAITK